MKSAASKKPIHIMLVEDNPGDVRLTQEALTEARIKNELIVAGDGLIAWNLLREKTLNNQPSPDLILLDLNMPRMDGREFLANLKKDPKLKTIPVVILTTSKSAKDIIHTYDLHANCYVAKPVNLDDFIEVVKAIQNFWLCTVCLPSVELKAA